MKGTYFIIRNYLLNGVFAYAIFGVYALTLAPIITDFFEFGQKNMFIAVFGFIMLFAEFFALNFKLKMVRIRSEEKRILFKKETGKDVVPSTHPIVFFGVFMRIAFHVGIIMVCMTALGYDCSERIMSPQGQIAIMTGILLDIGALIYLYYNSDFYTDPPQNKKTLREEIKECNDWYNANKNLLNSAKHSRMEIICDIILHIYALMLFTSFWKLINETAIGTIHEMILDDRTGFESVVLLFFMLFMVVMIGLMPMRIAYWIEDSMRAYTKKEKMGSWIAFFTVAVFTCSPAIFEFIKIYVIGIRDLSDQPIPYYVGYIMSIILFLILLIIQIILFRNKSREEIN